jgi:hypothetical protein
MGIWFRQILHNNPRTRHRLKRGLRRYARQVLRNDLIVGLQSRSENYRASGAEPATA